MKSEMGTVIKVTITTTIRILQTFTSAFNHYQRASTGIGIQITMRLPHPAINPFMGKKRESLIHDITT